MAISIPRLERILAGDPETIPSNDLEAVVSLTKQEIEEDTFGHHETEPDPQQEI